MPYEKYTELGLRFRVKEASIVRRGYTAAADRLDSVIAACEAELERRGLRTASEVTE